MICPDFERLGNEAQKIHRDRLNMLIESGIYNLIILHGDYDLIGGDIMGIDSRFSGEPIVRLKASRSKQGSKVFYREIVNFTFDGETLSIDGVHPIFSGQIPTDEADRERIIGGAIKEAFENPKRIVVTDFDPRKLY